MYCYEKEFDEDEEKPDIAEDDEINMQKYEQD